MYVDCSRARIESQHVSLWTQRITLRWQQNLRFYERRYEVLRAFEDAGYLRNFREDEGQMVVRVGSAYQVLSFGSRGMSLGLLSPDADDELLQSAAFEVWTRLEPATVGGPTVELQWLRALPQAYNEARTHAARVLLGAPLNANAVDFALLYDGRSERPDAHYRLELGIVEAAEAPPRLARVVGRVGGRGDPNISPSLWQADALPPVALFCDGAWESSDLDDHTLEGIIRRAQDVRRSAGDLVDMIASRVESELR